MDFDAATFSLVQPPAGFIDDPYPFYAHLRAQQPVAWVPAVNLWMATRWDDVEAVAKDEATFTAMVESSPVDRCFGQPTIITTDGRASRPLIVQ